MKLLIIIFISTLFMDIPLNYTYACILTNRVNVITIAPKLTAPKLMFHFWMKPKQFSCCNTFYHLSYLLWGHHRNTLYQKMNMIFVRTNLDKMYFKSLFYVRAYINQAFFHFFCQNTSSIFYRAYQMIQQQTFVMTFINMLTHNTNLIQTATPQQADGELFD